MKYTLFVLCVVGVVAVNAGRPWGRSSFKRNLMARGEEFDSLASISDIPAEDVEDLINEVKQLYDDCDAFASKDNKDAHCSEEAEYQWEVCEHVWKYSEMLEEMYHYKHLIECLPLMFGENRLPAEAYGGDNWTEKLIGVCNEKDEETTKERGMFEKNLLQKLRALVNKNKK